MDIKISYDGKWPCLPRHGHLKVSVDGTEYDFGKYCLESGGSVITEDYDEFVTETGPWNIIKWPDDFPDDLKDPVLKAVNSEIPYGCYGGCI